ncbi:hypothetical protein RMATCC62417_17529 [Rhizopus microsporus]|nr:hypothetical protein RMATCC62417_17529 [Rhizopus microsporus]
MMKKLDICQIGEESNTTEHKRQERGSNSVPTFDQEESTNTQAPINCDQIPSDDDQGDDWWTKVNRQYNELSDVLLTGFMLHSAWILLNFPPLTLQE